MIEIQKSPTADTRYCPYLNTKKETLLESSRLHIEDVSKALAFFSGKMMEAAGSHDYDKLTLIDWFYQDYMTGFRQTEWWDNHRKIHRHHLNNPDGVPADVNLVDVIEYISDCVMAGLARNGKLSDITLPEELLKTAFNNTIKLLEAQVIVKSREKTTPTVEATHDHQAPLGDYEKMYKDLLNHLGVNGHCGAVAVITTMRHQLGLDKPKGNQTCDVEPS